MKTAHEVLHDINVAELRAEDEERKWTQLRRECQSPAVLGFTWLGVFIIMSLIGSLWLRGHTGDWKGLPFAFLPVLVMVPGVIIAYQRKQKALLKIIESDAPQLFQKLKSKGVV